MKIFKRPDLGEGLQEAEIVQWHVKAGDTVKTDQPMVSVETAKAIVDIPAPYEGKVARLFGNPGDIAHIGAPLVGFEGEGEDASAVTVVGHVEAGQKVVREAAMGAAPMGASRTTFCPTCTEPTTVPALASPPSPSNPTSGAPRCAMSPGLP